MSKNSVFNLSLYNYFGYDRAVMHYMRGPVGHVNLLDIKSKRMEAKNIEALSMIKFLTNFMVLIMQTAALLNICAA